jgi:putative endonuclease
MLNLFQHPRRGMFLPGECAMPKQPCVYMLANGRIGAIYIGVTSNLLARLHQHRSSEVAGFTARYEICRLVRFEMFADMPTAIAREKQLKRWHREWKMNLIERDNPHWDDLAVDLGLEPMRSPLPRGGS